MRSAKLLPFPSSFKAPNDGLQMGGTRRFSTIVSYISFDVKLSSAIHSRPELVSSQ